MPAPAYHGRGKNIDRRDRAASLQWRNSRCGQGVRTGENFVSVKKLAAYLRKLHYVYPYHQAIGFYMERAGYDERLLKLLEDFPIEYDFYLQHAMRSPVLNNRWRLYVPKGF